MKISLNWLSDYVEIDRSADKIAEILSDLGLPNEGIDYLEDDTVIDLEVTSNRGDCLSHIGIARELATATGKKLRLPKVEFAGSKKNVDEFAKVEIFNINLNLLFSGTGEPYLEDLDQPGESANKNQKIKIAN